MLKVLFLISLIAFILGQTARIQFDNGIAVTFLDISVGLFIGVWFVHMIYQRKSLKDRLFLPILLFFTAGTFSLIINSASLESQQLMVSFLYALRWLFYAGLYFAVKDFSVENKRKVSYMLIIAGGVVVFLGFLQYFFYNNLRNLYYLQWDDHLYRMFSSFLDPNFAGVFFSLFLFLTLSRMADAIEEKDKRSVYIFSALGLMTLLAVVLTYSRTAIIALVVGTISLFLLKGNKKLTILFLFIGFCFLLLLSNVGIEGRNPFRAASSVERIHSMQIAFTIIERNPVFGVGFNAYRYAQNKYGFRTSEKWQVSHADAGTDNSFLFVWATTGIVGLLAYGFLWVRILQSRIIRAAVQPVAIATLCGLLASSFFLNTLFYPMLLYWIWVLLGITESKRP